MLNSLERSMRSQLERAVCEARITAEAGAKAVLEYLAVPEKSFYSYMDESQKDLRRRLRVHGRQLGDQLNGGEVQSVERLTEEIAYEHWHRMLFARFLAENRLLMYGKEDPIDIDLPTCQGLIDDGEEDASSVWELASRLASEMLPQIFRSDSPSFELKYPAEYQLKLEMILSELPEEIFHASDSLGWVYQYWQSKRKKEVNDSEVKIGERELPSVTQLFTENYMVRFLLDNSLGAWWASMRLTEKDLLDAPDEQTLRQRASIPGVPLEFLRFVKTDEGSWSPASGTFPQWPRDISKLKILDPCCGSGHFLVEALLMLIPMRMELEGITEALAIERILKENLYGLELDRRCVELAAFSLAFTAWRYPNAGGYRNLPELNIACSGLSVKADKQTWGELSLGQNNFRIAMNRMYDIFIDAPILGSLLDPMHDDITNLVNWNILSEKLNFSLRKEWDDSYHEAAVAAKGLSKAAELLSQSYDLILTNVPYLSRGKQDEKLKEFADKYYPEAKNDLATIFLDRCLKLCRAGGTVSIVLPQNWLFLTSYKKFREKLLKRDTWNLIARLGSGAFDAISGEVVKAILITLTSGGGEKIDLQTDQQELTFEEKDTLVHKIRGLDVSALKTPRDKAAGLLSEDIKEVEQARQLGNPDAAIVHNNISTDKQIGCFAFSYHGITTTDYLRFGRLYWENYYWSNKWINQQSTIPLTQLFGGLHYKLLWEDGNGDIKKLQNEGAPAVITGLDAWGKRGIVVNQMRDLNTALYSGNAFDTNVAVLIPKQDDVFLPLWCFCSSSKFNEIIRQFNQSMKVEYVYFPKVPFDLEYWTKVAEMKYPLGLPKPYSDDPTQWIFHGHPCGSVVWDENKKWTAHGKLRIDDTVLQIAVARLLGYRWPAELYSGMELSDEQRAWVKRCEELVPLADTDGIVAVPALKGELTAVDRLMKMLYASYEDQWKDSILEQLLASCDHAGRDLENWLRDKFFMQHCRLFQHRPFIWQVWDGLRDGFSALVNYHKLDYKLLESLTYAYLGDWINRVQYYQNQGVDGAEEKLRAAYSLQKKLVMILEGEAPYDIFVRWKPLSEQPVGWNPDLNDGVRMSIRPFMSVPDVGKAGAGILRDKPNIKWGKDRGKDVKSAPWHHLFNGERINDHHLSLEEKRNAKR